MQTITANTRLARVLQQAHDREQIRNGLTVWVAPDILPIGAWMERAWRAWLYSTTSAHPLQLLSPAHERAIWEDIVRQSEAGNELLQTAATADAAFDVFRLLHAWHVPLDAREWRDSRDTEVFRGWAEEFRRVCERRNWLSSARLSEFIAARVASGEIPVPEHIQFAGFAEFTPAQNVFLEALRLKGTHVEVCAAPIRNENGSAVRVGFVDTPQEIRAAARWARMLLEAGAPPSIGIVVPDLSTYRSPIERLFAEELHPGGRLSPDQDPQRAFNISLGPSFSDYPLIQTALMILRWDPESIPFRDVTRMLCSPFIARSQAERIPQALLDVRLRELREPEIGISEIVAHAPEGLKAALNQWKRERSRMPLKQMPSDWASTFSGLLKSIGWPGDRALNSTEYQTTAAWNEMLSEFAGLDSATGLLPHSTALSILQRLAADRQFQPESEPAPIQILGVFEASGMTFDHLWIVGMHDGAWPRSSVPNPFLPLSLQRARNMPQSSPQRELEFTTLLTGQLLASSPDIVLSYPTKDGDADLRPSPLFVSLPEDSTGIPMAGKGHAELLYLSKNEESIPDNNAPTWNGAKSRGGVLIFASQAACPFQAFAKVRLGAQPLESAMPGLSPLDRGILIHDVFHRIWNEFGSHETLMGAEPGYFNAVVHDEVAAAIAQMKMKKRALRQPRFADIEQERLERLVYEWLELEKQRRGQRCPAADGNRAGESDRGLPVHLRP